jgi:hypothetical protein
MPEDDGDNAVQNANARFVTTSSHTAGIERQRKQADEGGGGGKGHGNGHPMKAHGEPPWKGGGHDKGQRK